MQADTMSIQTVRRLFRHAISMIPSKRLLWLLGVWLVFSGSVNIAQLC
jgi:hypothetical protein